MISEAPLRGFTSPMHLGWGFSSLPHSHTCPGWRLTAFTGLHEWPLSSCSKELTMGAPFPLPFLHPRPGALQGCGRPIFTALLTLPVQFLFASFTICPIKALMVQKVLLIGLVMRRPVPSSSTGTESTGLLSRHLYPLSSSGILLLGGGTPSWPCSHSLSLATHNSYLCSVRIL